MVVWVYGNGVMVDPMPHATAILHEQGVEPRKIHEVVLTHCHADHDAGTFQKVLHETRINVMTTKTIVESFVRKYSLISGFSRDFLYRLFEFRAVQMGETVHFGGGTFRFFYTLHALPCIGFKVHCGGKSIVYSADTYYDPEGFKKLLARGIISEPRMRDLLAFPFEACDLVFHEAGIAPIHTPLAVLEAMPQSVREKMYLMHTAQKVAADSSIKYAEPGIENTITLDVAPSRYGQATEILRMLRSTDIFRHFLMSQAADILQLCRVRRYAAKAHITQKGEPGEVFYLILSGQASVFTGQEHRLFGYGDYLGEIALLSADGRRTATVTAVTDVTTVELDKYAFQYMLDTNPGLKDRIGRLSEMRSSFSWKAVAANTVLSKLTNAQKVQLQSILLERQVEAGTVVWKKDAVHDHVVLVFSGEYRFEEFQDEIRRPFTMGSLLGDVSALEEKRCLKVTLKCVKSGTVLVGKREEFLEFLDENPGLLVNLIHTAVLE